MKRNWKLIALVIAAGAVLVWVALFVTVGGDFYKTVDEVQRGGSAGSLRVGGTVAPDSIIQKGGSVRFALEGSSGNKLAVVYSGTYPERLGPYQQVVVSGSLGQKGELVATQVLVKCPSKLLPERAAGGFLETIGLKRLLY